MKSTGIALVTSLAALATAVAVAGAWAQSGPPKSAPAAGMAQLRGVNFVSNCRFSHRAPDDPIVAPGRAGASHDHSFVGSTSTNAFSTLQSLRRSATTCMRPGDTAAYWMPTLLVGGAPVEPLGATVYYRRRTLDAVRAFPPGFRMIAGSALAQTAQDRRVTFWNCGAMADVPPSSTVPTCPAGRATSLRLHVTFPSCWTGSSLDSADHQSHVAYPTRGRCPASHPVAVPAISVIFRYPVSGGAGTTLSSGGQFSAHADFFNAWNQGALTRLVNGCLNALRHCGRGT
ncbi:MAG: DUF1996 domain-containing protein [Actinomycetota bacterium]|nr:DUF1996 domain-containing protein [Actinomycetota bacterium]